MLTATRLAPDCAPRSNDQIVTRIAESIGKPGFAQQLGDLEEA
jgi:hypothetical protein